MENFLLYILRSGLYIGIFYSFFLLVNRNLPGSAPFKGKDRV